VQAARAAEAHGVPFCLSTVSACSLVEVTRGTTKPFWFQLYMLRDRAFMQSLLDEALNDLFRKYNVTNNISLNFVMVNAFF
jgi:isopentenyl diphosphate isomerase/L-lactate dehydrogenase-like FMN-dependent dehydrogenase